MKEKFQDAEITRLAIRSKDFHQNKKKKLRSESNFHAQHIDLFLFK